MMEQQRYIILKIMSLIREKKEYWKLRHEQREKKGILKNYVTNSVRKN